MVLNFKHALPVLAKGSVFSSLLRFVPTVSAQLIHGNQWDQSSGAAGHRQRQLENRLLLNSAGNGFLQGSLACQPTPTHCFLIFIETSLSWLLLPTPSQNQHAGESTRGNVGSFGVASCGPT